jgi:UDP-N-acetylglucosamine:LPS N-acetylglucosamine transferase
VLPAGGAAPRWPDAPGKRVFGYVKKFDGLGELASALRAKRVATLLYLDGPADAAKACESDTVCVARERPDMARVARECDAAVMHAGQGTTAALLMAGKPLLNIPLVLEQRLTANAVRRTGAGLVAPASSCDEVGEKLDALLDDLSYANAARRVALKYASFDPAAQVARMVARVEGLIEVGGATATREKLIAG